MLTKTADYALRAVLALARHTGERPLTAERISELTGTPANYMSKTLYALAKNGLVRSIRGPAGGFALATAPDAITIAEIATIFADRPSTRRCLLGSGLCNPARPCAAHSRWSSVLEASRAPLATTTIADLLIDAEPFTVRAHNDSASAEFGAPGLTRG